MKKHILILTVIAILVCCLLLLSILCFGYGQAYLDSLLEKEPVTIKLSSSGDTVILGEERVEAFLQMMERVTVSPASNGAINKEGAVPASITFIYEDGTSVRIGIPLFRTDRGVYRCSLSGMPILDNKSFREFFTPEPGEEAEPVYEVVLWDETAEYTPSPLYLATTEAPKEIIEQSNTLLGTFSVPIAQYTTVDCREEMKESVENIYWLLELYDEQIINIYYLSGMNQAYSKSKSCVDALVSLAEKTSVDTPMYLVHDENFLYAVIGETAYFISSWGQENAPKTLPDIVKRDSVKIIRIDLKEEAETTQSEEGYPYPGLFGDPVLRYSVMEERSQDLDECGQEETLQLLQLHMQHGSANYALRIWKDNEKYDTPAFCRYNPSLWITDCDLDGCCEVFVSGDVLSADYSTHGWRLMEQGLEPLSNDEDGFVFFGQIMDVQETVITLQDYRHVLGTNAFRREFSYDANQGVYPLTKWKWEPTSQDRAITVIEDLPVYIDGSKTTLPSGTSLWVTGFDDEHTVQFQTTNGIIGSIELERSTGLSDDTGALWYIEGRPETDYFENIMYFG